MTLVGLDFAGTIDWKNMGLKDEAIEEMKKILKEWKPE